MNPFDLKGLVAVVTGGNGGIGLGMARGLAKAGAAVVVAGRNPDKNAAALSELKALGADRQVLVLEGLPHPVLCQKIRYYKDKRFTARLLPKAPVPLLQIDLAGSA